MLHQGALDLCRLDAKAADLDLRVGPPEEFERAILEKPSEVAGAIHASRWDKRIRLKALGGQRLIREIAVGQTVSADPELTGKSFGHRTLFFVEHVNACICERPSNRGSTDNAERREE